jgi:predicted HicB family RNase H-like nuclease
MDEPREPWSQLATRIPKGLHRRLKLYCVEREVSVMDFVTKAVREKLAREGKRGVGVKER